MKKYNFEDYNVLMRVLDNGFFITHEEMQDVAKVVRGIKESNEALQQNLLDYTQELNFVRARMRGALSALMSGSIDDVQAAIEILRGPR